MLDSMGLVNTSSDTATHVSPVSMDYPILALLNKRSVRWNYGFARGKGLGRSLV